MKFRRAMMACFLVFSLVPLYLLGYIAYRHNTSMIKRTVSDSLETISRAQIARLEEFCENRRQNLYLLGQTEMVQDALLISLGEKPPDNTTKKNYVDNLLQQRRATFDYLHSISLIDRNYILVSSSEPHVAGMVSTLKDSAENYQRTGFYMGSAFERPTANGSVIRVVTVYESVYRNDELLGYLVEEIPTAYFDEFRYELDLASGCTMYLTDKNDAIITAGTSSRTDGNIQEYVTTEEERLEYSKKWASIDWNEEPSGSFSYTVNHEEYITSYSSVKYTDWKVCINADLSVYYQATGRFRFVLVSVIGLLTVCLLGCNAFFSHWLSSPIEEIMTVLRKVRENNDYTLRVEYESPDEFGQLSRQLNSLLEYAEEMRIIEEQQKMSLRDQAARDPLTGLYNKTAINEQIDQMIAEAGAQQVVAGFIDLDDFRNYNTLYGHAGGDRTLQFVAKTMKSFFGNGTGRNGGDEFLFWLVKDMSDEVLSARVQRFLETLNAGFYSDSQDVTYHISCSIGVAVENASTTDRKLLIHHADIAMYQAKDAGKNNFCILKT